MWGISAMCFPTPMPSAKSELIRQWMTRARGVSICKEPKFFTSILPTGWKFFLEHTLFLKKLEWDWRALSMAVFNSAINRAHSRHKWSKNPKRGLKPKKPKLEIEKWKKGQSRKQFNLLNSGDIFMTQPTRQEKGSTPCKRQPEKLELPKRLLMIIMFIFEWLTSLVST